MCTKHATNVHTLYLPEISLGFTAQVRYTYKHTCMHMQIKVAHFVSQSIPLVSFGTSHMIGCKGDTFSESAHTHNWVTVDLCVCCRVQRWDCGVQEHQFHSVGCWWSGQDQTTVETLLPKHTGRWAMCRHNSAVSYCSHASVWCVCMYSQQGPWPWGIAHLWSHKHACMPTCTIC